MIYVLVWFLILTSHCVWIGHLTQLQNKTHQRTVYLSPDSRPFLSHCFHAPGNVSFCVSSLRSRFEGLGVLFLFGEFGEDEKPISFCLEFC